MMVVDINKLADVIKTAIMEDLSKEFLTFREELKGNMDTFRLAVEDTERRLDLVESRIESLDCNVTELGVRLQNIANDVAKRIDELEVKMESAKTDVKSEIGNMNVNLDKSLKAVAKNVDNTFRVLNDMKGDVEEQIIGLVRYIETVHRDLSRSLNNFQKTMEQEIRIIRDVQSKMNELSKVLADVTRRLNDMQEKVNRMENEFGKRICEITREVDRLKSDLKKIKVRDDYLKEIITKINSVKREARGEEVQV